MYEEPILVNHSAAPSLVMTGIRYGATSLAMWMAGQGLVSGDQTTMVAGLLTGAATAGWGMYRTLRNHRKLVKTANAAPDAVAMVR